MKISVIIPAAGTSSRFQAKKTAFVSKLLELLQGKPVLAYSISAFRKTPQVSEMIIAAHPKSEKLFRALAVEQKTHFRIKVVRGGKTRAESVGCALKHVSRNVTHVMVHDGARPLLQTDWIQKLIQSLDGSDGAVLGRMAVPTIKKISWSTGTHLEIEETLNRSDLFEAETPQLFKKEVLCQAYDMLESDAFRATDDASIVELAGGSVRAVLHEGSNLKITTKEDLALVQNMKSDSSDVRFGLGFDRHRLVSGRIFWLGGIKIPARVGPLGHSDGDPLLHAVIDGMLGALGLGDIGDFFSDKNPRFKNIKSTILLKKAEALISKQGFKVAQIDATIFLEAPKLGTHKKKIQVHLAKLLGLDISKVGIKAKTTEGLGAEGAGVAVSAQALVVLAGKYDPPPTWTKK